MPKRPLLPYLKPIRLQLILGPLCKLVEAVIELYLPLFMARLIDVSVTGGRSDLIAPLGLQMLIWVVVGMLFSLSCQYMASVASSGFAAALRSGLFAHILRLPVTAVDALGAGTLSNRINVDVTQMQQGVAMTIRLLSRAPFLCIGGLVMAFRINARLSLVLMAAIPLVSVVLWLVLRTTVHIYRRVQRQLDRLAQFVQDHLNGIRVIRAFDRAGREREIFSQENTFWQMLVMRAGRVAALMNPLSVLVFNLGIAAVLYLGGVQIGLGVLTRGELIALINYFGQIVAAMIVVANLVLTFTRAAASTARVSAILSMPAEQADRAAGDPAAVDSEQAADAAGLCLENVSYTYLSAAAPAVSNISLTLRPGETLGIIGGTGSGKSTLAHLMAGFYRPSDGRVFFDGSPVGARRDAPRHPVQLIFQKPCLFSGTVREQIKVAAPDASDADIWTALDMAQAGAFMRDDPAGLDRPVVDGGVNFSGGQRQRLAIARALLSNPSVLILDDCSSGLDYVTDVALGRALKAFQGDRRIRVIISQRVYAVAQADRILVMDDGRAVDMGPHAVLLERCALYREICETQMSDAETDTGRPEVAAAPEYAVRGVKSAAVPPGGAS